MVEFMECSVCAVKPGSPILCPSCLYNRDAIHSLQQGLGQLRKASETLDEIEVRLEKRLDDSRAYRVTLRDG